MSPRFIGRKPWYVPRGYDDGSNVNPYVTTPTRLDPYP